MSCAGGTGTPPNCECLASNQSYLNSGGTCSCYENASLAPDGTKCGCNPGYPIRDDSKRRCTSEAVVASDVGTAYIGMLIGVLVVVGIAIVGASTYGVVLYRRDMASLDAAAATGEARRTTYQNAMRGIFPARATAVVAPAGMTSENGGPENGSVGGAAGVGLLTSRLVVAPFSTTA